MEGRATLPAEQSSKPFTTPTHSVLELDPKLLSTPSNLLATAATAEDRNNFSVTALESALGVDIKKELSCDFTSMLEYLLQKCSDNIPSGNVFDDCIKAVLPICNKAEIRDHLDQYCNMPKEVNRYGPLVKVYNVALEELKKIHFPALRQPQDSDLLFHVNDRPISSEHGSIHTTQDILRKPDIVAVPLHAARRVYDPDDHGTWPDYAHKHALKPPEPGRFLWREVLSSNEVKVSKSKLNGPPPTYTFSRPESPTDTVRRSDIPTVSQKLVTSAPTKSRDVKQKKARRSEASMPLLKKRRSTENQRQTGKRPRTQKTEEGLSHKVQVALYAAERMSDKLSISHVINLLTIDERLHIFYYDREGIIHTSSLDFIQHLPYLVVLLMAFQRFKPENWGVMTELSCSHNSQLTLSQDSASITVTFADKEALRRHYGLLGRCTRVYNVTSSSSHPTDPAKKLDTMKLILKISWPETSRISEQYIIEHAMTCGKEEVQGHIPDLILALDFKQYSTDTIRSQLGLSVRRSRARIARALVFRRLHPITKLTGTEFWDVFLDCFRCHYELWEFGIHHRDISVNNLMYDTVNGSLGVLNDFDLATRQDRNSPTGSERTGTLPFMALELLREKPGSVQHEYYHDFESFMWVLIWILGTYEDGSEVRDRPYEKWVYTDPEACEAFKFSLLGRPRRLTTTKSHMAYLPLLKALARSMFKEMDKRDRRRDAGQEDPEGYNAMLYRQFLQIASRSAGPDNLKSDAVESEHSLQPNDSEFDAGESEFSGDDLPTLD